VFWIKEFKGNYERLSNYVGEALCSHFYCQFLVHLMGRMNGFFLYICLQVSITFVDSIWNFKTLSDQQIVEYLKDVVYLLLKK
jgi:hypothetical protein